jgi:hypothetical protein
LIASWAAFHFGLSVVGGQLLVVFWSVVQTLGLILKSLSACNWRRRRTRLTTNH